MYSEGQKRGISNFCSNPYWKGIFDNAPSQEAKNYFAEHFAYSDGFSEGKEHSDAIVAIYKSLSPSDWDYIIKNSHWRMAKWCLTQAREKYATD